MKKQFVVSLLFAILLPAIFSSAAMAAALRRVDMIVGGSSCASCLIRIEKKLKASPGVLKAMVSVYRPYAAVVIYDAGKTSMAEITKVLSSEKAQAEQPVDVPIKTVPALLLPAINK
ncbi:hypothetical protein BH11CYA1_BH11CYA1_48150 [soil metagenome]